MSSPFRQHKATCISIATLFQSVPGISHPDLKEKTKQKSERRDIQKLSDATMRVSHSIVVKGILKVF
eukprot:scaffold79782_cov34-Attheya_sp.AAC.3